MSSRRMSAALVGGLIVAALFAAYFGLRSPDSNGPGPSPFSEPDSKTRIVEPDPEEARQSAPPPTAAIAQMEASNIGKSFQTLRLCAYASGELAAMNYLSNCDQYEGRTDFQELYAQCLNGWMNVPSRKVAAEAALKDAGCGDMTDINTRYFEATKQAAKAGDADAQMCYLQGEFSTTEGKSLFSEADVQEYGRVAPQYVDAALRRGDWRIVELMTKSDFHPGVEPIRQIRDIGKPETVYKMTKLLRLGATGSYAESLDMTLDAMIHPTLVPEAALPAEVVKNGDAWARQTFNEHFSGVVGLTERPTVCMAPLGKFDGLPGPANP